MLLFLACTTTLTGQVQDPVSKPLAGVTLDATGCRAVTDGTGEFIARCDPAVYSFTVHHPDYLDQQIRVDANRRGGILVPTVTLRPVPTEPGLYVESEGSFRKLAAGVLKRTDIPAAEGPATLRYCAEGRPEAVTTAGRWLDVHGVDWRIFKADDNGCFYKMTETRPGIWSREAEELKPRASTPFREGESSRLSVDPGLPPGRYAILEWLGETPVEEPTGEGLYRGWWIEVS